VSEVVGSAGVGLLLVAFALQRLGFIPFVVLELAWCLVALWSLFWGPRPAVGPQRRP
jgi:hypothetical protein